MSNEEIRKRNSAILNYMGGPFLMMRILHEKDSSVSDDYIKAMAEALTIHNLRFHESWDWLIPAWSKIRFKLSPTAIINAVSSIDDNDIEELFEILSVTCMQWCDEKGFKYE